MELPLQLEGFRHPLGGQADVALEVTALLFAELFEPAPEPAAEGAAPGGEKPNDPAGSDRHGTGTRHPSREMPLRAHIGSCRAPSGTSASGSPSSCPWYT